MKNRSNRCSICKQLTTSEYDRVCSQSGCRALHRKRLQLQIKEQRSLEERFMQRFLKRIRKELAQPGNVKLFSELIEEELVE